MYIFKDKRKTAHHVCGRGREGRLSIFKHCILSIYPIPSMKDDDIYLKFGHFCGKTDRQTDIVVYMEVTLPKMT